MEPKNVQAKNLALVGTFFIGYFLIATLDSLQSSFYPSEAKKRGASAYQVYNISYTLKLLLISRELISSFKWIDIFRSF